MKVLLINDCAFQSLILKDILIKLHCDVKIANEYNALIEIDRYLPDIVIANLIMKDIRGDELIREIKDRNNKVKCILSSSSIEKLKDVDSDVDEVLPVPVSKEKVENVLMNFKHNNEIESNEKTNIILNRLSNKKSEDVIKESKEINNSGKENNKFKFCPQCGKELGSKLSSFKFCPYCGDNLSI